MLLMQIPSVRDFFGQRLGHGDDRAFTRRIRRHVGVAFFAGDGGDIHDASVAALAHVRQHGPAEVERAVDVDVEHFLPFLVGIFPGGRGLAGDAGVVHQNIDAPLFAERLGDRRLHLIGMRDVDHQRKRALDRPGDVAGGSDIEIGNPHGSAGRRQPPRDRLPNSRRRAGHDGGLSRQFECHEN